MTIVGMHTWNSQQEWAAARQTFGDLKVIRLFQSPADGLRLWPSPLLDPEVEQVQAWRWLNTEGAPRPFISHRPDPAAVARGDYDIKIRDLARSLPTHKGPVYWTLHHEPEGRMKASTFVSMYNRFYDVAKSANASPNLRIGPVYLSYHWRPSTARYPAVTYSKMYQWRVRQADFMGIDVYSQKFEGGVGRNIGNHPGYSRWASWVRDIYGLSMPRYIVERGVLEATPGNRAAVLHNDLSAMSLSHRVDMYLYWNTDDPNTGQWKLMEPESIHQMRQIVAWGNS